MSKKLEKEDLQCLIEKLTTEPKKSSIENIEKNIAFYKNIIKELEQEKHELQKYSGVDELQIGQLTVQSNYTSWNYWKNKAKYANPLYLSLDGRNDYTAISLNLHDMKKLRDYLTDKLEFAEYE